MKVSNMTSPNGNDVPNQFVIEGVQPTVLMDGTRLRSGRLFQSYKSNIAFIQHDGSVFLDEYYWNYSRTTSKYRSIFLNETTKETQAKIDSGEYRLVNLND